MGLMHGLPGRDKDDSAQPEKSPGLGLPGRDRDKPAQTQQTSNVQDQVSSQSENISSQYEEMFSQQGQASSTPQAQGTAGLLSMLLGWLLNRFLRRR